MSGAEAYSACRVCDGRGKKFGTIRCRSCGGSGRDRGAAALVLRDKGRPFAGVEQYRDSSKEREIWPRGAPISGRAGFIAPTPQSSTITWSIQWDEEGYAEIFMSDHGDRASDYDCAAAMRLMGLHAISELNATTANQSVLRGWQVRGAL